MWGVEWDADSHPAIDVYDNALYLTAIDAFVCLPGTSASDRADWSGLAESIRENVRRHLWDARRAKFRPHVYLDRGSPFPAGFDEERSRPEDDGRSGVAAPTREQGSVGPQICE